MIRPAEKGYGDICIKSTRRVMGTAAAGIMGSSAYTDLQKRVMGACASRGLLKRVILIKCIRGLQNMVMGINA